MNQEPWKEQQKLRNAVDTQKNNESLVWFITGVSSGIGRELVREALRRGHPVRAAQAVVKAVASENPPLHLLLGRLAYEHATTKLKNLRNDIEAWRE
jgi:NAD(P)-dependent dehydrogenase (short-subunit alcohol dehydrogenase family)